MKALLLSAGQGKRCLPLTNRLPKCLLPVDADHTILSWQLAALANAGIREAAIVTGFEAGKVERELARQTGMPAYTIYNPFYDISDNLASVWCALGETAEDYLLINGDTLFSPAVPERLVAAHGEITVTISQKAHYDADDMKVRSTEGHVGRIGKDLDAGSADGEAIGITLFRGDGRDRFAGRIRNALRTAGGRNLWYPAALDEIARSDGLATCMAAPDEWCEVDEPADLEHARDAVRRWRAEKSDQATGLAAVS